MSSELVFQYEELPLLIEDGIEAGLVSGEATIAYYPDGEWSIHGISLDGFKKIPGKSGRFENKQVELDNPKSEIYLTILDRLCSGKWRDAIDDRVAEELADEGVILRDERAEHSTLHYAAQGV